MAREFSMSQILLKLGVKWPLVKAIQLHYFPAWSEMVRFSSFVIIHESRISGETQMAGEFSMTQILLKLGVKWPLVKAFQLHYIQAWSEVVRFSSFVIIFESRVSTTELTLRGERKNKKKHQSWGQFLASHF